jgi:hypothetical protein
MKKSLRFLRAILFVSVFSVHLLSQAQILVHTKTGDLARSEILSIQGRHEFGTDAFVIVPDLQQLDQEAIPYSVLDSDLNSGTYFWADNFHHDVTSLLELCQSGDVQILWQNTYNALVRSRNRNISRDPGSGLILTRIRFQKTIPKFDPALLPGETRNFEVDSVLIQTIMDSVNLDTLYYLQSHLTGEMPFQNEGSDIDSIMTRYSYNVQIAKAQDYIHRFFEAKNYTVALQSFALLKTQNTAYTPDGWDGDIGVEDITGIPTAVILNNIIATKTGTTYPDEFFIICGHYDATSQNPHYMAPGADDNGTGTVAVMEAARVLANYDFMYSIKFILFPGEEQGLWGSQIYVADAALRGDIIRGALNLDMIGWDGDDDGHMDIHVGSMQSSQELGRFVSYTIDRWKLDLIPNIRTYNSTSSSDHSPFWSVGYPALLIIEDMGEDFNPFYHSTGDLLSRLNPAYYHNISRLAIGSLAILAVPDTNQTSVPTEKTVPKQFQLSDPYPNPFNPEVTIEYFLPSEGFVFIEIFDILGHSIIQPVQGRQISGHHQIVWDGSDQNGRNVSSGVYLIRVRYQEHRLIRKMILLK